MRVGDKPGPDGPDDETVLKAWDMRVNGDSPAAIAEAFSVSVSTAKRYVKQGRELAEVVEYQEKLDHPAKRVDLLAEQSRQAATTDAVIALLGTAVKDGTADPVQAASVILKALERRAAALGTDPPRRLAVRDDRTTARPEPSPWIAGAIEQYDAGGDPADDEK